MIFDLRATELGKDAMKKPLLISSHWGVVFLSIRLVGSIVSIAIASIVITQG